MPIIQAMTSTLAKRAVLVVNVAPTLDRAVKRLAGVLYPSFFPQRIDVGMRLDGERVVLCAVWSARQTRLSKGTVLQAGATGFPDIAERRGVVFSSDVQSNLAAELLEHEGLHAWAAIPIPSTNVVEGGLGVCAHSDVFREHREFFEGLGIEISERLAELARESEPYVTARESPPDGPTFF